MTKTHINQSLSLLGFTENSIVEALLVSHNADSGSNIAPMGITKLDETLIVKPFKTCQTHENMKRGGSAAINITSDPLLFLVTAFKNEFSQQPKLEDMCVEGAEAVVHTEIIGLMNEDELRSSFKLRPLTLEIKKSRPKVFSRGRAEAIDLIINATRLQVYTTENRDNKLQLLLPKIRENIEIINKVSVEGTSEYTVVEEIKSLSHKWGVSL